MKAFIDEYRDAYGVELIGARAEAIAKGEDRDEFKGVVDRCGAESARSVICHTIEECRRAAERLGYVRNTMAAELAAMSQDENRSTAGARTGSAIGFTGGALVAKTASSSDVAETTV